MALTLYAQRHTPAQRYELFKKNLEQRGAAITRDQFKGIGNLEEWKRRRPEVRRQLLDMLGLDPMPSRTPLNARVTGGFERAGYRVENIVFESRPKLYVTGNLYLPKASGKVPPIVYVTGHSPNPAGAKVEYQHHGIWFAKNGFAAFVLDTIEFGEIPGIHHGIHNLRMEHWLSLGYGPAGVEVWNAIRALDYLETRPEIDRERAGITGRSGGGAITWFTAAVDERFKAASPVHGTWTVGPHVAGDSVRENCDCIYFWNTYQLDLPVVGALIAPRPLKIVNATKDVSFPPAGYEPVQQCLRPVYEWYGAADKLAEHHEVTGHVDTPPYRKAANEWLNQWLRDDRTPFDESGIEKEEDVSRLLVLKQYPPDAVNEGIHRSFIPAHKQREWKTAAEWNKRRQELIAALRDKVYRAAPKEKVALDAWKAPFAMWTNKYSDSFNVEFNTEENIRVHGQLFVPRDGKATHPALIYVKGAQDIIYPVDYDLLLSALTTHVVLVLNPRAVDYPMDNYRMATAKMTLALLGGTIESMQVWDIQRAVDFLLEQGKLSGISVYGRKNMGALALHAAALDDRITRVIIEDVPPSHWQGPPLLNVLRLTDLPEVAALVAPREIVSLTPLPGSFGYTSLIYKLYGKSLREASALAPALRVWQ
jgi:cephalosporin-C deacetylase-like acetyl esterase